MATPTPGVHINKDGKKIFVPLENNPQVFTELVRRIGLDDELEFYDIYSVDDPGLLAFIPRPVVALIFIAPADIYHRVRAQDAQEGGTKAIFYDGCGDDEPIIWFKQTIGHACGLIALLHSVMNGPAQAHIKSGSLLDRLRQEAVPLKPLPRAGVLYDSKELEEAHMACAMKGDSVPPSSEEPNGYHFISFVRSQQNGQLYELEGGWGGPIDRGSLKEDEDLLSHTALSLTVTKYLKAAQGNLEFSMIALAPSSG